MVWVYCAERPQNRAVIKNKKKAAGATCVSYLFKVNRTPLGMCLSKQKLSRLHNLDGQKVRWLSCAVVWLWPIVNSLISKTITCTAEKHQWWDFGTRAVLCFIFRDFFFFHRDDFNIKVLQAFVELHEFADLNLVQALRWVGSPHATFQLVYNFERHLKGVSVL